MIKINENYLKLQASYLFSEIRRRTDEFQAQNPDKEIIKLGIGDVTRPLPQACIEAAFGGEVDILDAGLRIAEFGGSEPGLQPAILTLGGFAIEQEA